MPHATPAWFFFGDSLTQGVNDQLMPGGWASRLAVLANEAGLCSIPRATFYNLGARRHSTATIAARWRSELESRLIPGMEPRLVFCTGVVDMAAPGGGVAADPTRIADQFDNLLAQAASVAPTLAISPPASDGNASKRTHCAAGRPAAAHMPEARHTVCPGVYPAGKQPRLYK